jgi:hypothetical protein
MSAFPSFKKYLNKVSCPYSAHTCSTVSPVYTLNQGARGTYRSHFLVGMHAVCLEDFDGVFVAASGDCIDQVLVLLPD